MRLDRLSALAAVPLAAAFLSTAPSAQHWLLDFSSSDHVETMAMRDDGTLTLVGTRKQVFDDDLVLHGFEHDGSPRASVRLAPVLGGDFSVRAAAPAPGGDVVVAGAFRESGASTYRPWIGRIDGDTGQVLWNLVSSYPDASFSEVAVTDNAVFAAGQLLEGPDDFELHVVRLDLDGNPQYRRKLGLPGKREFLKGIAPMPDTGLTIAFTEDDSTGHVVRLDSGLSVFWHRYYDTFRPGAICADDTGELRVAGTPVDESQVAVLALDPNGAKLWAKRYLSFSGGAVAIANRQDGGAVLNTYRYVDAQQRGVLLALDPSGSVDWHRLYVPDAGIGFEYFYDLVSAGPRGWITRASAGADRILAVDEDGDFDAPCVTLVDLVTSEFATNFPLDEPPALVNVGWPSNDQPLLLQPFPLSIDTSLTCGDPCATEMQTHGLGLSGSSGLVPQLSGVSGACVGQPEPRIELANALGGSVALLGYSLGGVEVPFLGGTLYLDPALGGAKALVLDGAAGFPGAGSVELVIPGDMTGLAGITVHTQGFVFDPGAVKDWAMSNALRLVIG